ncbi:hypothetical protein D3C79_968160 [compost metagenome]
MAQDHTRLVAEIAILDMQVGMANATTLHLQQRFPVRQRPQCFFHHVHATPFGNNSSFHKYLRVWLSELERVPGSA